MDVSCWWARCTTDSMFPIRFTSHIPMNSTNNDTAGTNVSGLEQVHYNAKTSSQFS